MLKRQRALRARWRFNTFGFAKKMGACGHAPIFLAVPTF